MVKVGFIVEGTSDYIILKSEKFQNLLKYTLKLESNVNLIRIARSRSKLKKNLKSLIASIEKDGIDYIFILVDQDDDKCPLETKHEILSYRDNTHYSKNTHIYIVMSRTMEAWLLADKELKFNYIGKPEDISKPSNLVEKQLGTSSHVRIARKMEERFSLERAAENAPSAKRFLDKLIKSSKSG